MAVRRPPAWGAGACGRRGLRNCDETVAGPAQPRGRAEDPCGHHADGEEELAAGPEQGGAARSEPRVPDYYYYDDDDYYYDYYYDHLEDLARRVCFEELARNV